MTTYGYDAAGHLTSVTPPGRPATVLAYDDRGVLTSITPPTVAGSGPTLYARDADRALTSVTHPGGRTVTLGHDSAGRLASRTLATGATTSNVATFAYDATSGRLGTITGSDGITVSYTLRRIAAHERNFGAARSRAPVTRGYDSRLKIATETVAGTPSVAFAYDADGLLTAAGALAITRDGANGVPDRDGARRRERQPAVTTAAAISSPMPSRRMRAHRMRSATRATRSGA